MNVSTVYGFTFLCVPKTGSTSIKKALLEHSTISYGWKHSLKHMSARTYQSQILPFHKKLFPEVPLEVSCVMREPASWAHSWYRFRQRRELLQGEAKKRAMYTGDISFETFVDKLTDPQQNEKITSIADQSKYILLDDGEVGVDKIFRFEDGFAQVEEYFAEKIGQQISIQKLNKSPTPERIISAELQDRLKVHFARDQKLYESLTK